MVLSLFLRQKLTAVVGLFTTAFLLTPLVAGAQSLFEEIRVLQQQIQVIEDAVIESEDISFTEEQQLLNQLTTLTESLASLQIAIGENSNIRTNVRSFMVSGDVQDFTAEVEIVYDEEIINGETLPVATSTFEYGFTTPLPETEVKLRSKQLRDLVYLELIADTGLPLSFIKKHAKLSFHKFDDEEDVLDFFGVDASSGGLIATDRDLRKKRGDLLNMFGQYSIINDIEVFAGMPLQTPEYNVQITFRTDQNETLQLFAGTPCRIGGEGDDLRCRNGQYEYVLNHFVNDVLVFTQRTPTGDARDVFNFVDQLLDKSDVGEIYGETDPFIGVASAPGVNAERGDIGSYSGSFLLPRTLLQDADSETVVAYLISQWVTQQVTYKEVRGSYTSNLPDACVPPRVKASVATLMEFFMVGYLQIDKPIYEMIDWYVPLVQTARDETPAGCTTISGRYPSAASFYFSNLPVGDWEAAIEEANPDTSVPWFLE